MKPRRAPLFPPILFMLAAVPASSQHGAAQGEWRFYGGDAGSTKYAPLDQINASNVKQLTIAWRWKAENFGPRPDYNWEVTPLMVRGVLYFTAGSRRDAVAVDAATGETLRLAVVVAQQIVAETGTDAVMELIGRAPSHICVRKACIAEDGARRFASFDPHP